MLTCLSIISGGIENAKRTLKEIVILPSIRPEVFSTPCFFIFFVAVTLTFSNFQYYFSCNNLEQVRDILLSVTISFF